MLVHYICSSVRAPYVLVISLFVFIYADTAHYVLLERLASDIPAIWGCHQASLKGIHASCISISTLVLHATYTDLISFSNGEDETCYINTMEEK